MFTFRLQRRAIDQLRYQSVSFSRTGCFLKPNTRGVHAPRFELKDQYDNSYSYSFPKRKVSVLAFSDRKMGALFVVSTGPRAQRTSQRFMRG